MESFQAREIRNFNYTKKLMNDGVPVIFQAVLHDYENQTYGCPDLIVRSDLINGLFNQELLSNEEVKNKAKNSKGNYFSNVDIKHSTLHLMLIVQLRNRDSVPAYKGQLYIYNEALVKIQGYNPMKAYSRKNVVMETVETNFLENLGTIDYSNFDNNIFNKLKTWWILC